MNKYDTIERLQKEALQSLQVHIEGSGVEFILAEELMKITEECPEEFLARERDGFFAPLKYASEIFRNFEDNQTFYFDKLVRIKT